jgi:hypothetical protein
MARGSFSWRETRPPLSSPSADGGFMNFLKPRRASLGDPVALWGSGHDLRFIAAHLNAESAFLPTISEGLIGRKNRLPLVLKASR